MKQLRKAAAFSHEKCKWPPCVTASPAVRISVTFTAHVTICCTHIPAYVTIYVKQLRKAAHERVKQLRKAAHERKLEDTHTHTHTRTHTHRCGWSTRGRESKVHIVKSTLYLNSKP